MTDSPTSRPALSHASSRATLAGGLAVGLIAALIIVASIMDGNAGREKFLQLLEGGFAAGSIYSLLALAFVLIYKATGIFNLALGGLVILGTFLTYEFAVELSWPFALAGIVAVLITGFSGVLIERSVMRPMLARPNFTATMVTLAVLIVLDVVVKAIWSEPGYVLSPTWSRGAEQWGGVTVSHVDMMTVGSALLLLGVFFWFFSSTRLGLSIRAASFDREAASAQGVRVGMIFSLVWGISAVVATIAGVLVTFRSGGALTPNLSFIALRAFPAVILGGLDSTGGAVAGGLLVGLAEVMVQGYLNVDWLGDGFQTVVPYLVLLPVLLWRPYGLFGTKTVERA